MCLLHNSACFTILITKLDAKKKLQWKKHLHGIYIEYYFNKTTSLIWSVTWRPPFVIVLVLSRSAFWVRAGFSECSFKKHFIFILKSYHVSISIFLFLTKNKVIKQTGVKLYSKTNNNDIIGNSKPKPKFFIKYNIDII